jgi:uncharacterized protein YndB with AHSA1/START domain
MTNSVRREAVLPAAPADVWELVTGDGWLAESVSFELRPGGEARFATGEVERQGWVEEVRAPQRLAFWWASGEEPASRVELTLEPVGPDATRLRVCESRPLDVLDLVGLPLAGPAGPMYGPALLALR